MMETIIESMIAHPRLECCSIADILVQTIHVDLSPASLIYGSNVVTWLQVKDHKA